MPLESGTRLGPYEILAPLGAGAMGEVYRALDPRLKREVALKILPAELASEPERLKRFEREGRALAALNHPHIVTIHSVEEADGLHFLTMELVEGKSLADLIPRGGFPLSQFLRLAVPLADAVSAAHEKGITHRDLKPGNVMVTDEGRVKVLDFGLAKPLDEGQGGEAGEAPTWAGTRDGLLLGTAPYMSPEQVQGKAADQRSDVFSLGILLYEMATGERPFAGETLADLTSSILRDTPVSVSERKTGLPQGLGKLIRHCLEKEPRKRFQSTLDLANELEELKREVDTGEAASAAPMKHSSVLRRSWLAGLLAVAVLAPLAAVWWSQPGARVVCLMDTTAPYGVYDDETRARGGTNADDLSDLLGDLPVTLVKEAVNPHWRREHQVLVQRPALVVVHRSSFAHQPGVSGREEYEHAVEGAELEPLGFENPYQLGWSRLKEFLGYLALGNPDTKFLVYSRSFVDEAHQRTWISEVEMRFPELKGKITTYKVPTDENHKGGFHEAATGAEIRRLVMSILELH